MTTESIMFGLKLEPFELLLARHSAFAQEVENEDGDWGVGEGLEIRFDDDGVTPWAATMTGPLATWSIPATEVDAVIDGPAKRAALWYVSASAALRWTNYGPIWTQS